MRKILIAAGLVAGFVASGVAHADEFNGSAQRSVEYFHNGRNAPPSFGMVAANPNASDRLQVSTGAGFGEDAYNTKSHGHP